MGGDEETDQDKHQGGVFCKGQGWRVVKDNKGGRKQEDEKRGGGEE